MTGFREHGKISSNSIKEGHVLTSRATIDFSMTLQHAVNQVNVPSN